VSETFARPDVIDHRPAEHSRQLLARWLPERADAREEAVAVALHVIDGISYRSSPLAWRVQGQLVAEGGCSAQRFRCHIADRRPARSTTGLEQADREFVRPDSVETVWKPPDRLAAACV